ncbi:MAG: hypothetical protein V2B15_03445 [Bacteroidota bacterium]
MHDRGDKYTDLSELISEHAWETVGVYHAAPPAHHYAYAQPICLRG